MIEGVAQFEVMVQFEVLTKLNFASTAEIS